MPELLEEVDDRFEWLAQPFPTSFQKSCFEFTAGIKLTFELLFN